MKIRSSLTLYKGENKRTNPIQTGYRSDFVNVHDEWPTTGVVPLTDREKLFPGDQAPAIIDFLVFVGTVPQGTRITFCEGSRTMGEAMVLEVLSENWAAD